VKALLVALLIILGFIWYCRNRISSAERKLRVLAGQINTLCNRDGACPVCRAQDDCPASFKGWNTSTAR